MAMDFQLISTKTCSAEEIKILPWHYERNERWNITWCCAEGREKKNLITVVKFCEIDKIRQNL